MRPSQRGGHPQATKCAHAQHIMVKSMHQAVRARNQATSVRVLPRMMTSSHGETAGAAESSLTTRRKRNRAAMTPIALVNLQTPSLLLSVRSKPLTGEGRNRGFVSPSLREARERREAAVGARAQEMAQVHEASDRGDDGESSTHTRSHQLLHGIGKRLTRLASRRRWTAVPEYTDPRLSTGPPWRHCWSCCPRRRVPSNSLDCASSVPRAMPRRRS